MGPSREEESRLQVRTLIIASAASLAAALVTSRFWVAGTPIAAALTPVIVAIVSEMLHRPTEAIARRVTTERTALLPEAMGAGPPEPDGEAARGPAARDVESASQVRVYRPERRRTWGRIHPKLVVLTAVLAFAIAAAVLTLPELIAGQSLGKGDRNTTLFGGRDRDDREAEEPAPQQTTPEEQTQETPTTETEPQEETQPEEEPPATTEEPPLTVPTVPPDTPPVQP
jgi:hypothetical protein